ncbi:MAG TPA: ABC transporter substrate-binding protein [Bradyrhizobium sp.]|jgi:putative ABC transport system substrate-binding protein
MRRREFIKATLVVAAFSPRGVLAQQSQKIPRIGVLWHAGSAQAEGTNFPALVKGFSDLGYIEGRNIVLEHRFPNEVPAQFERMAAELVASGVDVLVAVGANAAPYAKAATTVIPVVFTLVPDPLGSNLVKSLARPEANVTGFSNSASDLVGKRLELLRELVPELSRVALLVNSNSKLATRYSDGFQAAASNLGLSGSTFTWLKPEDLESVFAAMKAADVQALMINPDGWAFTYRAAVAKLAMANRLVLSSWSRQTFDAGAFMSYGVDHDAICHRVAVYVDKLLKGAKPGDLPVELPTKFEFLISLRTAKALGRDVPAAMLSRADEVVE